MNIVTRLLVLLSGLALITGCTTDTERKKIPLESGQVAPALDANLKSMSNSLDSSMDWLGQSKTMDCIGGEDTESNIPEEPEDDSENELNMTQLSADLVQFLNDEILNELENTDGSTLSYRMDPIGMFCTHEGDEGGQEIDQECADVFEGNDITIEVVSYVSGDLDLTLVINDIRPLTIEIHQNKLALNLNLGETKKVWDLVSDNFDTKEPLPFTINALQGVVSIGIESTGPNQLRAFMGTTSQVVVDATVEGEQISVKVAPSEGAVSLDQLAKTIEVALNVGSTNISFPGQLVTMVLGDGCGEVEHDGAIPWDEEDNSDPAEPNTPREECEPTELKGLIALAMGGLTGSVELTDIQQAVTLKGFGFGPAPTTVSLDGKQIVSLDLNTAIGGTLDASITICGDNPQLTFAPSLSASLAVALGPLADTYTELKGTWIENETLSVFFDGTTPTLDLDGMKVVSGELRIESSSRPELNVTVGEGQCLEMGSSEEDEPIWEEGMRRPEEEPEDDDKDDHPFAEMASGTCEG